MVQTPSYLPTSKENALYSIYQYLMTWFSSYYVPIGGVKAPTIYPIGFQQSFTFPCITMEDVGLADLPGYALGDSFGGVYKGKRTQTMLKLVIYDQNTDSTDTEAAYTLAEQNVRRLRDIIRFLMLTNGEVDLNNEFISSPIYMLDPIATSGLPGFQNGFVIDVKTEESGGWRDMFMANGIEAPNLKKYEIYIRIEWPEIFAWPSGIVI